MPGKGRRVASRQAQVGSRRRRQHRGPSGTPAGGPATANPDDEAASAVATEAPEAPAPQPKTEAAPEPRSAAPAPQRPAARTRTDRPAAYNYVTSEVRRILIVAGALTAVLVALAFFI